MIDPPKYIQPMSVRESQLRCVIADLKTQVQERDAVLRMALSALEGLFGIPDQWTGEGGGGVSVWRLGGSAAPQEAITAIKRILNG